jgi:predicted double-glycine peptidase
MLVLGLSTWPLLSWAASVDIGTGIRVNIPLRSLKDFRDSNLVRQAYDYSCGAAALATLLTYGLEDAVTEQEILRLVLESLAKDEKALRQKQGLSLLDLQRVAQARGHKAGGFRLAPVYLPKLQRPVIAFIKPRGYEHFAVFRGLHGNRVYLADPSLGNVRMSLTRFLNMWLDDKGKGIIFVVERKSGEWTEGYPLQLPVTGLPQPEILTVRQMLEVGNPYVRFPRLSR